MISIKGGLSFGTDINTVAEIREFLAVIDQYGLPDETPVMPTFLACVLEGDAEPTDGGVIVKGLKADAPDSE